MPAPTTLPAQLAEADAADQAPANVEAKANSTPKVPKSKEPKAPRAREGSKQAHLIGMLRRAKGATINEVVEALEWQPHTVRGAITGALKKFASM